MPVRKDITLKKDDTSIPSLIPKIPLTGEDRLILSNACATTYIS